MIILIDFYNYTKSILKKQIISEQEKIYFIEELNKYLKIKNNTIILAIDAGPFLYQSSEYFDKIKAIYSGQNSNADAVIKNIIEKNINADILLISSDNELKNFAKKHQIEALNSIHFYTILKKILNIETTKIQKFSKIITKITDEKNPNLDKLMELSSRNLIDEKNILNESEKKELKLRASNQMSKKNKNLNKKIAKL